MALTTQQRMNFVLDLDKAYPKLTAALIPTQDEKLDAIENFDAFSKKMNDAISGQLKTLATSSNVAPAKIDAVLNAPVVAKVPLLTQITDAIGKNAPALIKALTEAKVIKTNLKLVADGKPPLSTTDVLGFGEYKNALFIGGGLIIVLAMMKKGR